MGDVSHGHRRSHDVLGMERVRTAREAWFDIDGRSPSRCRSRGSRRGSSTSCSGLQYTSTDRSSDSDAEITAPPWTFGDGGSASGATASRTYADAGTYIVDLAARDAFGATVHVSQPVAVAAWNLRASLSKVKNVTTASLTWNRSATAAASVDVFRNGARVATASNTGAFSQTVPRGSWSYVVCPAGDARCSNAAPVKA